MMAKFDMNMNNIRLARQTIQALPDEQFLPLMNDETASAIAEQLFIPIKNRNTHLNADETKELFGISTLDDINELKKLPRKQLAVSSIAYYKARLDITPDRNKGMLRKALQCFGMGDDAENYINNVCKEAGISRIPQGGIGGGSDDDVTPSTQAVTTATELSSAPIRQMKTEQEKDAEQRQAENAVKEKLAGKRKSVKESASAPISTDISESIPKNEPSGFSRNGFWNYDLMVELLNEEPEPWLVHGLFRKGSVVSIPATQNDGKTMFLLDLFGAIASGVNFLPDKDGNGGFPVEQGACIYLDFEGDKQDTIARVVATLNNYHDITGKNIHDIPLAMKYLPIEWSGSDENFPMLVHEAITALPAPYDKPVAIGFDTYSAFSGVENENDRAQATKVFNRLKKLKSLFVESNPTIFIPQHLNKLRGKPFTEYTMDDISGAGSQAAAASDIWLLGTDQNNKNIKLLRQAKAKGSAIKSDTKVMEFRYDADPVTERLLSFHFVLLSGDDADTVLKKQQAKKKSSDKEKENQVLAFIAQHQPCSLSRIWKPEYPDRLKMGHPTAKAITDNLLKDNRIFLNPDGTFMINPLWKKSIEE